MITFQYNLTLKNHFKSLIKNQLKTITIFLLIFTFCYFSINMEAFLYNFPYNTKLVLITYLIYLSVIFVIMFIISLIFSFILVCLFRKNSAYRIYVYKLDKNKLTEKKDHFLVDLKQVKKLKITKKYIRFFSLKLKQVITFEKIYFINPEDFIKLSDILSKNRGEV